MLQSDKPVVALREIWVVCSYGDTTHAPVKAYDSEGVAHEQLAVMSRKKPDGVKGYIMVKVPYVHKIV